MTCPHCNTDLPHGCPRCHRCGFSVDVLRSYLGAQWVRLDRITDAGGCLRLADRQRLELALDDFERQFPQCFFAVYLGALPSTLNVRELGFWLLNHGAFNTHLISKRNDFGMVLVIDPFSRSVSFTLGYSLEPVLHAGRLDTILKKISPCLRRDHHAKAVQKVLAMAARTLRPTAQPAIWTPSLSPAALQDITDMGFQPLKPEHRSPDERISRKTWR